MIVTCRWNRRRTWFCRSRALQVYFRTLQDIYVGSFSSWILLREIHVISVAVVRIMSDKFDWEKSYLLAVHLCLIESLYAGANEHSLNNNLFCNMQPNWLLTFQSLLVIVFLIVCLKLFMMKKRIPIEFNLLAFEWSHTLKILKAIHQ